MMLRLLRWTTALAWGLMVLTLSPTTSSGQTPIGEACEPPRRCRSAAEVNRVADALCARARAKEERYDDLLTEAGRQRMRANQCEGQLRATGDIAAMVPRLQDDNAELRTQNAHAWIWELAAGVTGAAAVGAGWCVLDDRCPEAAAWSLVGALGVGVVVQAVRWVSRP